MARIASLAVVALATASAPAAAATRSWPLAGFERVELDAAAEVTVAQGRSFSIRADGDPTLVDRLTATVRDGTLILAWREKPPPIHDRTLRISVSMPRVAGAGVKGVGHLTVDRADTRQAVFAVEGTGSLEIASLRAETTVLSLSGTGSITVAGTTGHLDARRSGVGSIEADRLQARSAVLMSAGIGSIGARVDGPVTVTQSGIGSVSVAGRPRCTVQRSGIGSVDCG